MDDDAYDLHTFCPPPPADGLDVALVSAARHLAYFSRQIDLHWSDWHPRFLASALATHARVAARLGEALRLRQSLSIPGPPPVDVDDLVADLDDKLARLSRYIDGEWPDQGAVQTQRFLALYCRNLGRLEALWRSRDALRKRRARGPTLSDPFSAALDQALDQLSQEWGIDL